MALADDLDRILWTEDQIAGRVAELASQISGDFKHLSSPPVVIGVATGAFVFLADIVRKITLPVVIDFIRVESYGSGTESSGTPRISSDIKVDVSEKHVILVEDIVDTGNTLSCLIPHLKKKGASSVSVCTFLDKPARRRAQFQLVGDGKFYNGFEEAAGVMAKFRTRFILVVDPKFDMDFATRLLGKYQWERLSNFHENTF